MFHEETGDAARARKKREAAKLNRQKANNSRKKKEAFVRAEDEKKRNAEISSATSLPPLTSASAVPPSTNIINSIRLPSPPTTTTTSASTIVEQAAQRRTERLQQRRFHVGVLQLQAVCRRKLSNINLLKSVRANFDSKLSDLKKLVDILQTPSKLYKPPPATATLLLNMFLFLSARSASPKNNFEMLTKLTTLVLNNGVGVANSTIDLSLHPLITYPENFSGRRRLTLLLTHSVSALKFSPANMKSNPILLFLNAILSPPDNSSETHQLAAFSRNALFTSIQITNQLRAHLLTSYSTTSPPDETRSNFSSTFFSFVLHQTTNTPPHTLDFALSILSVPLLSHKLSNANLETLRQLVPIFSKSILDQLTIISSGSFPQQVPLSVLLPSYPLTEMPVPATLALFANIISLHRNAQNIPPNPNFTIPLLSILLNEVPLGTLGSSTAVTWITEGTQSRPIVIPVEVITQAKGFLLDSFLRPMVKACLNEDEARVAWVNVQLSKKSEQDHTYQKDFEKGGKSAAAMAVASAKPEARRKSAWLSSKWAKKLSSLVSGGQGKKKR